MAANEDLAKNPTDEHAYGVVKALEGTLAILVELGSELTEAIDKKYGHHPIDEESKELSDMLHTVFQVPLVN